jgi:hypothetical protein
VPFVALNPAFRVQALEALAKVTNENSCFEKGKDTVRDL